MTPFPILLGWMLVAAASWTGQASPPSPPAQKPGKLLSGKLIYVAPMPDNLDQWIADDLRAWQKYRVTANSEGVDLVVRATSPEKEPHYVLRKGIPQPKKERSRPPALSISVVDWVTGKALWDAAIVDKKPKPDEPEAPLGPHAVVYARGLKPDQLAEKVTRQFRQYVEALEAPGEISSRP